MAAMNEVMSHKNRYPKWMAESYQPAQQVENRKHMDPKSMAGRNQKEAAVKPKASKAPEMPQTHFRVKLCCNKCEEKAREEAGEVPGVVSLITDARESRVTVLGGADPAAVLKKLKKHVDKKAMYWPADLLVPKAVVGQNVSGGGGERVEKAGNGKKKMGDGAKKGGMKGGGSVDKELGGHGNRAVNNMDAAPGMNQHEHRVVEMMRADPRMVDPRNVDPMRAAAAAGPPRMIDPRMVDPRERRDRGDTKKVWFADDPREMRGSGDPREMRGGGDPREMRGGSNGGGGDVREMRHAYPRDMRAVEMREGWIVDPRDMRAAGEMRAMRPVDPREMRAAGELLRPVVDPRGMRWPMDAREMHGGGAGAYEYVPREMRPVDPRNVFDAREMRGDPRDYRYITGYPRESYYSSRPREADLHEYQPKDSYFSDYRSSQSYPTNYSTAPVSFYEGGVADPYYRN